MRKLLSVNNDLRSQIVPVALNCENTLLTFYTESDDSSDATTVNGLRVRNNAIDEHLVPSYQFDHIYKKLNIDGNTIVKIDVEGGELEVVLGMQEFLTKHRPIILCKVLHADHKEKINFIHERNARLSEVLDRLEYKKLTRVKSADFGEFDCLRHAEVFSEGIWNPLISPRYCDYIFVHASMLDEVSPYIQK
jgi:FkbM family methyltransferase